MHFYMHLNVVRIFNNIRFTFTCRGRYTFFICISTSIITLVHSLFEFSRMKLQDCNLQFLSVVQHGQRVQPLYVMLFQYLLPCQALYKFYQLLLLHMHMANSSSHLITLLSFPLYFLQRHLCSIGSFRILCKIN